MSLTGSSTDAALPLADDDVVDLVRATAGGRHCASDSHPLELAGITLSVALCAEIGLEACYLTGSANGGQDGILEANTCTWEVGVLVSTARTSRWMLTSLGRLASATAAPVLASPV